MKRLLLAAAGLAGSFLFLLSPASAQPVESAPTSVSAVVPASGSPPEAVLAVALTPSLPRVTVVSGDTLWALGIKFNRGWPALAAYNQIANPDLIYVGQVLTIPPASYNAPAPVVQSMPVHAKYTYAVANAQVSTPVSHTATYHVPVSQGASSSSGIWGCIGYHESGNNPATNTGNGYYGAFQDTISAWQAGGGGPGLPSDYSYSEQLRVNENLQAQVGWGAWPNTSRMCGV